MIMDRNIRFSKCKMFYNMKGYRFQVEISSSYHSSGGFRRPGDCSSRSQTSEGLMIVPSSSLQSDNFDHFSQGNPEDKQK